MYRDYLGPGGPIELPFDHWIVPQTYYYGIHLRRDYRPLESKYFEPLRFPAPDDMVTAEKQVTGELSLRLERQPKYMIGEIRYLRSLLIDHRIQYEIKHEQWESARLLAQFLSSAYPRYVLDRRVNDALVMEKQIE